MYFIQNENSLLCQNLSFHLWMDHVWWNILTLWEVLVSKCNDTWSSKSFLFNESHHFALSKLVLTRESCMACILQEVPLILQPGLAYSPEPQIEPGWFSRAPNCTLPSPSLTNSTEIFLQKCSKYMAALQSQILQSCAAIKDFQHRKVSYTSPNPSYPIQPIPLIAPLCFIHL